MQIDPQIIEGLTRGSFDTKLRGGKYYERTKIEVEDNRLFFYFGYNKDLIAEIKESLEDRRWHGFIPGDERKVWSAPITFRNLFQLQALMGKYAVSPYSRWDDRRIAIDEVLEYSSKKRPFPIELYHHQADMASHGLSCNWFIWAAEMGTGKTLAAIILLEMAGVRDILWAAPTSAIAAAKAEFLKWRCNLSPTFLTYAALRGLVQRWPVGKPAPKALILDESSRAKNPVAQQSVAAKHVADSMRLEYGDECYIGLLSGTPAPKSPPDWWMQCEIACPGFVREQNIHVFRERLGIFEKQETETGQFKKLVTWKDDESKCSICGKSKDDLTHDLNLVAQLTGSHERHKFVPMENEVTKLKKRLNGLVLVKLKKDCLDLPDKQYHTYRCTPSQEILNAAKLIVQTTPRVVDALIKLRTLSDGFLYKEEGTGEFTLCDVCNHSGTALEWFDPDTPYYPITEEEITGSYKYIFEECPEDEDPNEFIPKVIGQRAVKLQQREITCPYCNGEGKVEKIHRTMDEVECPKDDVLLELLEKHEEVGRLNIYAGFQGSLDRVVRICHQHGWSTFQADGRGWKITNPMHDVFPMAHEEMLVAYDQNFHDFPKTTFVGQPGAAGMGVTLTASPGTFFFSNDNNPANRMQAEDRGHRLGMDREKGGWIYDVIHLPSDEKIINTLRQSKELQLMSLTGLKRMYE